jgi:hypothetical protein
VKDGLGKRKLDGRRTPVNRMGMISFAGTKADCLVLNLSANGAGLALASDVALPLAFELEISGDRTRRHCVMVWRIERRLGVMFSPTGNSK